MICASLGLDHRVEHHALDLMPLSLIDPLYTDSLHTRTRLERSSFQTTPFRVGWDALAPKDS
jgi:hypothetical protein